MEEFIVSARKYRPGTFKRLLGQDNIATTLKNSIKRGELAHAYLFCGPRGVGKTSTARIFAKSINCYNPDEDMEPCGQCQSCLSFDEGRSFNIHELDAASNNSVDDIRLLTEKVRIVPQIGKYSVYIIDEVHMLSQAAFNAFLKTLEEPPPHAIFILATTEKHKILPTILSRCQTYDFSRITTKDMVINLKDIASAENINVEEEALHIIALKADGAMRDALTLFDQMKAFSGKNITYDEVIKNLDVLDYDYFFRLTDMFLAGDIDNPLLLFDEILSKGFNAFYFLSGLSNHFRDLMVCKGSHSNKLLETAESLKHKYMEQAGKCSLNFLFKALDITTSAESSYRTSGNQRLLIEFALIKIASLTPGALSDNKVPQASEVSEPQKITEVPKSPEPTKIPEIPKASEAPEISEAPQVSQVPEASVSPARKNSFSLKDIISKVEESLDQPVVKRIEAENDFDEAKLEEIWKLMAQNEKLPRLSTAINEAKPEVLDDKTSILFHVGNSAQKEWIERNALGRMEGFLQNSLNNRKIKLYITVKENTEDDKKKHFTPVEKANFLLSQNEELRNLKNDLDLDVK